MGPFVQTTKDKICRIVSLLTLTTILFSASVPFSAVGANTTSDSIPQPQMTSQHKEALRNTALWRIDASSIKGKPHEDDPSYDGAKPGPIRQKNVLPLNRWGIDMSDEEIQTLLDNCALYNDVTVSMALAVIQQESGFTRDIVSNDGRDWGYFQIRDSNHEWLQEATGADPKTPLGNIICGVYMLHYCHTLYGPDHRTALTAYRWGSNNGNYTYADLILSNMADFD